MENYELKQIINNLNKPLFLQLIPSNHLIFVKYSSTRYYKYAFELLDTLTKKSLFQNKIKIFHTSLYYLLKILFNCGNVPYCSNYDLIILSCFFLGVKTIEEQKKMINITKLKNIYPEKYSMYDNSLIKKYEMTIIYLLQYDINILTIYDCICFLLKNESDTVLKKEIFDDFEFKLLNEGVKYYIFKKPMDLAQEIISEKKQKYLIHTSRPCISKKKMSKQLAINAINNCKTVLNFRNIDSPSTSASFGSGQNSSKKETKINKLDISNLNIIKEIESNNSNYNGNTKNNYNKMKNQSISIKLKPIPDLNLFNNHNMRYTEKGKQVDNIDYFLSKNNNVFQSSNELANTIYKLNHTTNNEKYNNNDNNNRTMNNKYISNIIIDNNNCLINSITNKNRNKSIFKKPLITSKNKYNFSSNNNINNNYKNNLKKNKLCKNYNIIISKIDINNNIINKSNTNNNLYTFHKNFNNNIATRNSMINRLDKLENTYSNNTYSNNTYSNNTYKNNYNIRRKTLIQKYD